MGPCDPNSTPKLSLSKLPCKPRERMQIVTPPIHPLVSIPFRWEEAPGKPRAPPESCTGEIPAASKTKAARRLDLPPRLVDGGAKVMIMPSPETALDGPFVGRSLSLACTFSFRKGMVVAGWDEGPGPGPVKKGEKFGSMRWGSFRNEARSGRGNFGISHTLGEIFKSEKNVKVTRIRRRRSFFNLATANSNLLEIYTSFKHAVPWRRRR